jgi:L-ascorbate metabolism protein UlaG (beta-lactamase superfamily)
MTQRRLSATFLGHSAVSLELGGPTVLTDPVFSKSVAAVVRRVGPDVDLEGLEHPDVVVISHAHYDHLDIPTLQLLKPGYTIVVPRGVGRYVREAGAGRVLELVEGETRDTDGVSITAVHADHDGRRHKLSMPADALGYLVRNDVGCVYHAGDTALFAEMAALADEGVDLALMPVWGWGPRLGPGHVDPQQAAEATAMIKPSWAIPVHWGTLWSKVVRRSHHRRIEPPAEFATAVLEHAPDTRVAVLEVGETWVLPPA